MITRAGWLDGEIKLADSGDTAAVRSLLEQAADHLCAGQIEDGQLRLWLVDYLQEHIASLPNKTGAPSKIMDNFELALRVQFLREQGASESEAIEQLSEQTGRPQNTVRREYERYRRAAINWVGVHGCRLPNRKLPHGGGGDKTKR